MSVESTQLEETMRQLQTLILENREYLHREHPAETDAFLGLTLAYFNAQKNPDLTEAQLLEAAEHDYLVVQGLLGSFER